MTDVKFAAIDRRSNPFFFDAPELQAERALVVRPKGFFSLKFDMGVEEGDAEGRRMNAASSTPSVFDRALNVHLVCMTAFIGGSILLGWLMS